MDEVWWKLLWQHGEWVVQGEEEGTERLVIVMSFNCLGDAYRFWAEWRET